MRNRIWVVAAVVIGWAAGPAAAGPIRWGFRVEDDAGRVVERSGLTDEWFADYVLNSPYRYDLPPTARDDLGYTVTDVWRTHGRVTVIDEASGRTGQTMIGWEYFEFYERNFDGSLEPIHAGDNAHGPDMLRPDVFDLGGHRYSVYTHEPGVLTVLVSDRPDLPPNDTPEPGTLALAGLGLAAVGAARLRRRRA